MDDGVRQSKWDSESAVASSTTATATGGDEGEREVPLVASLSLVLGMFGAASGLLALGGVVGAVAVVLGVLARRTIRRDPALGGARRALVGIISGGVGIALSVMVLGAMFAVHITNRTLIEYHAREDCKSNLQKVSMAIFMYSDTSDGWMPKDLRELLAAADVRLSRLQCPSSPDGQEVEAEDMEDSPYHPRVDYVYVGSGVRVTVAGLERTPILWDKPENHVALGPHMTVLFADGKVETFPYGSMEALLAGDPTVVSPEQARALSAASRDAAAGALEGADPADGVEVDDGE